MWTIWAHLKPDPSHSHPVTVECKHTLLRCIAEVSFGGELPSLQEKRELSLIFVTVVLYRRLSEASFAHALNLRNVFHVEHNAVLRVVNQSTRGRVFSSLRKDRVVLHLLLSYRKTWMKAKAAWELKAHIDIISSRAEASRGSLLIRGGGVIFNANVIARQLVLKQHRMIIFGLVRFVLVSDINPH